VDQEILNTIIKKVKNIKDCSW